jgi:aspartyl-tRNA(Asn)/glutamyl-tRNA(Gln) amidotransferase subunit B
MRRKEEAHDYRYFPEPDLVPFVVDAALIERIRSGLPELPEARKLRFVREYGLSEYDAGVLTAEMDIADYFERCAALYGKNAKTPANWITGDIMAVLNLKSIGIKALGVTPEALADLLKMIDDGAVSGKMAKDLLGEAIETKRPPREIAESKGLKQISDASELEGVVRKVLEREARSVSDYRSGRKQAFDFLVGQAMRETKGKANPAILKELLKKKLGE